MLHILEFLDRVYGGFDHPGVLTVTHLKDSESRPGKKDSDTFKYRLRELEQVDWSVHQSANEDQWDIYFGLALRDESLLDTHLGIRGKKDDCVLSTALALDVDMKNPSAHKSKKLPASVEEAAQILEAGKTPSIAVHSGYGIHVYWLYEQAVRLGNKKEIKTYERFRKGAQTPFKLEAKRHGWVVDTTHTVDRIWRLPGFINWKDPGSPKTVEVLYGLVGQAPRYARESLLTAHAPIVIETAEVRSLAEDMEAKVPDVELPAAITPDSLRGSLSSYVENMRHQCLLAQSQGRMQDAEDLAQRMIYAQRLLHGESLDEKGNRDHALTTMCGIVSFLTRRFEALTEEQLEVIIIEVFGPSLMKWVEDTEDTDFEREVDKTLEKFLRFRENDAEQQRVMFKGLAEAVRLLAAQGVVSPQSEDGEPAPVEELSPAKLEQFGLITYGSFTYVWDWGKQRYYKRPVKEGQDFRSVLRTCWPEDDATCPFRHSFINEEGKVVELPSPHIYRSYCTDAEESHYSFMAQDTYFDVGNREFVIAPAPWRFSEAKFDAEIDEWLRLLGGPQHYNHLCDWLAGVSMLDRPCAAIYLDGPPGSGKSIFAHGAAQIWSTEAALYEDTVGQYNQGLMRCPVVLIDEGFVVDSNTKNQTKLLRRLVAQNSHSINMKYGPVLRLKNYLRYVIAANNADVLLSGREEQLTKDDSRALAERIVYIKVTEEAKNFFITKNQGNRLTNRWLGPEGVFAKHVLWLKQQRDLRGKGRFLVEGDQTEMHEKFLFQGEERNMVLEWIVRFSENPERMRQKSKTRKVSPAEIGDGIIALNTKLVVDSWMDYGNDRDNIRHSHLLRHLKSLSCTKATIKVRSNDMTVRYWPIPVDRIITYAKNNDIGDVERILAEACRPTDVTGKIVASSKFEEVRVA